MIAVSLDISDLGPDRFQIGDRVIRRVPTIGAPLVGTVCGIAQCLPYDRVPSYWISWDGVPYVPGVGPTYRAFHLRPAGD